MPHRNTLYDTRYPSPSPQAGWPNQFCPPPPSQASNFMPAFSPVLFPEFPLSKRLSSTAVPPPGSTYVARTTWEHHKHAKWRTAAQEGVLDLTFRFCGLDTWKVRKNIDGQAMITRDHLKAVHHKAWSDLTELLSDVPEIHFDDNGNVIPQSLTDSIDYSENSLFRPRRRGVFLLYSLSSFKSASRCIREGNCHRWVTCKAALALTFFSSC
ncbi:hypothetical protein B0H19DRAFT_1079998 [Mycena capillaripes]|nr:hypothetical protein B0H19DRAFT_1079998 [Mycena capillaripes]